VGEPKIDRRLFRSFCSKCNRFFVCYQLYQKHLQLVHEFSVKTLQTHMKPIKKNNNQTESENDIIDSSRYCTACKKTFVTAQIYYRHLINSHKTLDILGFELSACPPKNTSQKRDIHAYKCYAHDVEFKSKVQYVDHLRKSHEFTK
jgi:uncharacterized C2H2 Zn-finger protein